MHSLEMESRSDVTGASCYGSRMELNADILCEEPFGIIRGHAAIRKFIESYLSAAS
jgi:hypothetical protein